MTDGLVAALARCQAKFPAITKGHDNAAFRGSKYADVADVLAIVRPVLAAEGIVVTQSTKLSDEGGVTLVTALLHVGGEDIRSEFPLYVAGQTAQQVGSLITYHKRYQLCAILGVHPVGDDDDGNLAATAPARQHVQVSDNIARYTTPAPVGDPYALAAANPPDKPLAAMTAGEAARYGESIGVRVSGSKAEIIRQLDPYVRAAEGTEPFELTTNAPVSEGAAGSTDALGGDEPNAIPFSPVVAGAGSIRRSTNSAMKAADE